VLLDACDVNPREDREDDSLCFKLLFFFSVSSASFALALLLSALLLFF
jgi:hypothetical protein